eukprot:3721612-Alexandrium_andersonii.AAC.1
MNMGALNSLRRAASTKSRTDSVRWAQHARCLSSATRASKAAARQQRSSLLHCCLACARCASLTNTLS